MSKNQPLIKKNSAKNEEAPNKSGCDVLRSAALIGLATTLFVTAQFGGATWATFNDLERCLNNLAKMGNTSTNIPSNNSATTESNCDTQQNNADNCMDGFILVLCVSAIPTIVLGLAALIKAKKEQVKTLARSLCRSTTQSFLSNPDAKTSEIEKSYGTNLV